MKVSLLRRDELSADIVDRILYEGLKDDGSKGDCILVPGSLSATKYRVPRAVSIYNDKRAPKMLFCGGMIHETEVGLLCEAEIMRRKALDMGVPDEDVLLEQLSMTTKENMICALLVLERVFKLSKIGRILLVTTSYHMRRSLLMAQTYMPRWIEFSPCPVDDIHTQRGNWYRSESGCQRATDEAWKIVCYVNEGSLPDFEI